MVASQRFCLKSPMARRGVRSHRCPSVQRTTIGGGLLTTIGLLGWAFGGFFLSMTASLGDMFAVAAIIRQRFESTCEPVHITKVLADDVLPFYEDPPRPIPIPRPDQPPIIDDPPPRPNASAISVSTPNFDYRQGNGLLCAEPGWPWK